MADYLTYHLTVSVITPLHIGNGVDLLNRYDYAIHQGRTWRINEAAFLDAQQIDDPTKAEILAKTPPADLLKENDYSPESPFFRYVIKGAPRSKAEGAQLREYIKTYRDQPYLPGSSLKGALRTALAWYAWGQQKLKPELHWLNDRRQWAAQPYEKKLFGPDPNNDLLRALQVSDSDPVSVDNLILINVRVLNRGGSLGSPIEAEAIRANTRFDLTLKVDRQLYSDWAQSHGLHLRHARLFEHLPQVVNQHARDRIEREYHWLKNIPAASQTAGFYQKLSQKDFGQDRFLLQIGWGSGWGGKTFGSRLQDHPSFMEGLIKKYRLARGKRQPVDPFPKSRRLIMVTIETSQGKIQESIGYPLGWALVEMSAQP